MKVGNSKESVLVYSSEYGRICPKCAEPMAHCRCLEALRISEGDGIVRIRRETKKRGGKTVTVITGISRESRKLKSLAAELKRLCGSGGTVKNGIIEIQGDHAEVLMTELTRRGFRVKRSGG